MRELNLNYLHITNLTLMCIIHTYIAELHMVTLQLCSVVKCLNIIQIEDLSFSACYFIYSF